MQPFIRWKTNIADWDKGSNKQQILVFCWCASREQGSWRGGGVDQTETKWFDGALAPYIGKYDMHGRNLDRASPRATNTGRAPFLTEILGVVL